MSKQQETLEKAMKENLKLRYILKEVPGLKTQVKDLNKLYELQLDEHSDMRKEFKYEVDKVKNQVEDLRSSLQ